MYRCGKALPARAGGYRSPRWPNCIYTRRFAARFDRNAGKSERNLLERGFDFAFATLIFDGGTLERADDRRDYGEPRVVAIGLAEGIALTVSCTDRKVAHGEDVRRIISARLGNRRERMAYERAIEER